jgi:hypothetical protein
MYTKKVLAGVTALVLACSLLLTVGSAQAEEQDIVTAKHFNVMLVTDGSGSLITTKGDATDPDGVRYDAVDLFLGLLTNSGNNVGAIVFDNSDPMPLELAPVAISGTIAKKALSDQIRSAPVGGDTDIGSALYRAVQLLEEEQAENEMPSVVVILTDGVTDLDNNPSVLSDAEKTSLSYEEQAIAEAAENNIQVFSIMLNNGGTLDTTEAQSLATDADHFAEVTSAEDLDQIFAQFYGMIYSTQINEDEDTFDSEGKAHKEVDVPRFGVEELNIVIQAECPLTKVTVTRPDGTALTSQELEDYSMTTDSFQLIKITDPDGGTWAVDVEGTPNEKITFNTVYNADLEVTPFVEGEADSFTSGEEVTLSAQLYENSRLITDGEAYQPGCAQLTLTNDSDPAESYTYDMEAAGDRYSATITLPDVGENPASYQVRVDVDIDSITATGSGLDLYVNPDYVGLDNAPNTVENPVTVDVRGLDSVTQDLSAWFQDADGDELTYELVSSDYKSGFVTVENGQLKVADAAGMLDGSARIRATDPLGLSCTLTVNFQGNTAPVAISNDVEHRVTVNMVFNTTDTIDLTQWFSDEEDSSLTYEILDVQSKGDVADKLTIDNEAQTLSIATKGFQRSDVTLQATDSDGASCVLYVHFTILNLGLIASLGAATIIIAVLVILIALMLIAKNRRFAGEIQVEPLGSTASANDGFDGGFGSNGFGGNNGFGGGFDSGFGGFGGNGFDSGFGGGEGGNKQTISPFRGKRLFRMITVPKGNLSPKAAFVAMGERKVRIKSPTTIYTSRGPKKTIDLIIGSTEDLYDSEAKTTGIRVTVKENRYAAGRTTRSKRKGSKKGSTTSTTSLGNSGGFGGNGFV